MFIYQYSIRFRLSVCVRSNNISLRFWMCLDNRLVKTLADKWCSVGVNVYMIRNKRSLYCMNWLISDSVQRILK